MTHAHFIFLAAEKPGIISTIGVLIGVLVFIYSLIMLIVGLFNPSKALFWYKGAVNRKKSTAIYLWVMLASIIIIVVLVPKDSNDNTLSVTQKESVKDKIANPIKPIPAYFNADSLQAYYSAPPLNYYFVKHDGIGTYSTYTGYESRSIAESPYDGTPKTSKMEILFNPETKEIYRARIIIHNLKSYYPKQSELDYVFHFISVFDSVATTHFKRNYKNVFCYNENRSDSLEYENKANKLRVYVENDYDFSKEKKSPTPLPNTYIQIEVTNTGNEYNPPE